MTSMNMTWDPRWALLRGALHHGVFQQGALRHGARFAAFADRDEEGPSDPGDRGDHLGRGRGRRGHRRGPRGFGPGFGPGFGGPGFGPPFGGPELGDFPPRSRGHRRRRSRGNIRLAVLTLLDEQPRHGYEIIQEITERTSGAWRPSPGSVYPTLQQLEDEGLVRTEERDGRRTVELTEQGQRYVEEHRTELAKVWDDVDDEVSESVTNLRTQYGQLHAAVVQILGAGSDAQRETAANALAEARKTIYRLLAED